LSTAEIAVEKEIRILLIGEKLSAGIRWKRGGTKELPADCCGKAEDESGYHGVEKAWPSAAV
jgi:hypothetical protein